MATKHNPKPKHLDIESATHKPNKSLAHPNISYTTRESNYANKSPLMDQYKDSSRGPMLTEEDQSPKTKMAQLRKVLPVLNYNKDSLSASPISKPAGINQTTRNARNSVKPTQHNISPINIPELETMRGSKLNSSQSASLLPRLNNQSPTFETSPDINFIVQREHIDNNPHFSKYNKSIYALDKLEMSKIPLSKEFFYSPEQMELNQKFVTERANLTTTDQVEIQKLLRENTPETIELMKDKNCYFKVYAFDKIFPMKVDFNRNFGTFEIFVSKSHMKPDIGTCEYYLRNEHFQVDYSLQDNIRYVYIRVYALERTRFTVSVAFTPRKEMKQRLPPMLDMKASPQKEPKKKKKMYEFFHENMNRDELNQFKRVVNDIKKERKDKAADVGSGRNNVEDNMQIAENYGTIKRYKMIESIRREEVMNDKSRKNRESLMMEYEAKSVYNTFRHDLKNLERDWKISQEQEKIDTALFRREWLITVAMSAIMESIEQRRKEMTEIKAKNARRENAATVIQKYVRAMLSRPLQIRYAGRDEIVRYKEDTTIKTKISVEFYEAMKALALMCRKQKRSRAINEVVSTLDEAAPLIAISDAMNVYLEKVTRIQIHWKRIVGILGARLKIFKICWSQFIQAVAEEESKKKKKKNNKEPDMLSKIKEDRVDKHARAFVTNRLWGHLKKEGTGKDEILEDELTVKDDGKGSKITLYSNNSRQVNKANVKDVGSLANIKGKPGKDHKVHVEEEEPQPQPIKNQSKLQPSKEELKEIFDVIVLEIKQELGFY